MSKSSYSVFLDPVVVADIDRFSKARGISRSEWIRTAIAAALIPERELFTGRRKPQFATIPARPILTVVSGD